MISPQTYTAVFDSIVKLFDQIDTEGQTEGSPKEGRVANRELIAHQQKIIDNAKNCSHNSQTSNNNDSFNPQDLEKAFAHIVDWNREIGLIGSEAPLKDGSTMKNLEAAKNFVSQHGFNSLTNRLIQAEEFANLEEGNTPTSRNRPSSNAGATSQVPENQVEAEISDELAKEVYAELLKKFKEVDKGDAENKGFLTNKEIYEALKGDTLGLDNQLNEQQIRKIVGSNHEFKFLNIESGAAAWSGVSEKDLEMASAELSKPAFDNLLDQTNDYRPGVQRETTPNNRRGHQPNGDTTSSNASITITFG
jgi:hypothetical protein